ncbi:MAG TPA: hypothetical protein ENJ95_08405 [Bacteroidetes bacterium]|nr:hypothetical protein [Bacteroidota bacterium]
MKFINALFFIFLSVSVSFAQTEQLATNKEKTVEIGINATRFINEIISFNSFNTALNSYLLTYKSLDKSTNKAFRAGIGMSIGTSKNKVDANQSTFEERKNTFINIDIRAGAEKQLQIADKWFLNAGFDGIAGYTFDKVDTDGNMVNDYSFYTGGGPILGVQFMLTDRMGLLTEGAFYVRYFNHHSKQSFENNSVEDIKSQFYSIGLNMTLPSNVIFFIRF